MKLSEIAEKLHLECLTPELKSEAEADVTRGYVSDLLSDVLANAPQGGYRGGHGETAWKG